MKKILIILVSLLATGCGCSKGPEHAEHFTYEGHDYIYFRNIPGYGSGVVHDPNCWCMIDCD